jgi:hypothetical protein
MTEPTDRATGRFGWAPLAVVAVLGLAWCANRAAPPPVTSDEMSEAAGAATAPAPTLTLDEKRRALGAPPVRHVHGDDCTEDCSGHEAGYAWAERKDLDDESDCDTPSESFNEGCRSYVAEANGTEDKPEDSE